MSETRHTVEELLEPGYLEGLERRSVDEVRAMHEDSLRVETEISYARRLLQARIDILNAEIQRRATGGSVADLLAALPAILADHGPRGEPSASRLPRHLAPDLEEPVVEGFGAIVDDSTLANLPTLSDDELAQRLEELREVEHDLSARRRSLHEVIDRIEADLTERHKVGRA